VTTIEDLEHHAQALHLLMHMRGMGVVANVEQRIMAEAGAAWFAACDLILAGRTVPKRWLKVIEAWQEDWRQKYPEVPEFPEYPIDDIVLLAVGNPVQKTVEELESATRQQLVTYLQGWGFQCYDHESDADLRRAALENAHTEGATAPWPWRR
jgi:hypothetical protein